MNTVLAALNQALYRALSEDERVYILGEDILDPYGGAFKVTRGLSDTYPNRVWTTPISEAGVVGIATGMALRGLRPVVEIMFGDFITLAADQIINHLSKFRWMYNDQVRVPIVIRAPMGGRRGYGPTHSQTLEKHFLGVPGLDVFAPCALGDPGVLLFEAILSNDNPVLFIENKLLYLQNVQDDAKLSEFSVETIKMEGGYSPTFRLSIKGAPEPDITLGAYGYMSEIARQAVLQLAYDHEIFVELIVPTRLSPFKLDPILESAERTSRLLLVEEGGLSMGWSAEIISLATEALGPRLRRVKRVAARDLPIPASKPLENAVLPKLEEIIQAAKKMV